MDKIGGWGRTQRKQVFRVNAKNIEKIKKLYSIFSEKTLDPQSEDYKQRKGREEES